MLMMVITDHEVGQCECVAPHLAGWVGSSITVRSAHHAQINEPLQRPQVRRQFILNCGLSFQRESRLGDDKRAEKDFFGRLDLLV